jgi:hypothetical protein
MINDKFGTLIFTAQPDTSTFRAICRYSRLVFSTDPQPISMLPEIVAPNEYEFRLEISPGSRADFQSTPQT